LDCVEEHVGSAADNLNNALIITSGQQYSGRSSSLFGPNKLPHVGFLQLAINSLFRRMNPGNNNSSSNNQSVSVNEVTLGSFMGQGTSLDGVSLSIFDLYHDVARDFGVNLKANMTVKV
jgi:hypothetical protein